MPDPTLYVLFLLLFAAAQAGTQRARDAYARWWLRVVASLLLLLLFPLSLLMLRGFYHDPLERIPQDALFFVVPLGVGPAIILYFHNLRKHR